MRVPGRKLITRSIRWARSRLSGGILVLGYHSVRDAVDDPLGIAVSPSEFAAQLAILARRAQPMTLTEAMRAVSAGVVPRRSVVVTFDDGYADTLQDALPLLERHQIPATVFITTGSPGRPFWWDELADIVTKPPLLPPRLELTIDGSLRTWATAVNGRGAGVAPASRRWLLQSLAAALQHVRADERARLLARLWGWSGYQPTEQPRSRAMTAAEIQRLAASPLIDIGAHTVTHPELGSLPAAEQLAEISQSRAELERVTGREVRSFSYPHGSYSATTIDAVRRAGFTSACCSLPDVMSTRSGVFTVPRFWVEPRRGRSFERWLDRWMAA